MEVGSYRILSLRERERERERERWTGKVRDENWSEPGKEASKCGSGKTRCTRSRRGRDDDDDDDEDRRTRSVFSSILLRCNQSGEFHRKIYPNLATNKI
jgi:hypothetical protein